MKKHMCKDEYESKGNMWLCVGSCVSIALFVFGAMISINAEKYSYIYLLFFGTLAIIALSVYVYVSCRSKMYAIDMDIAEFKAKNKDGAESQQGTGAKHKENIVTIDRIIRFLRDLGYNPKCDTVENGIKWIEIMYAGEYVYIAYVKGMLLFDSVKEIMGYDKFISALQEYFDSNKFKIATPETLISAFEKSSGDKLSSLFESWINGKVKIIPIK
jgi:hypothetical protein